MIYYHLCIFSVLSLYYLYIICNQSVQFRICSTSGSTPSSSHTAVTGFPGPPAGLVGDALPLSAAN